MDSEQRKNIFVQIGAGAGDLDSRANFRDGFTEYVKKLDKSVIGRIILVEPNPVNVPALRQCWKDYPQAEVLQAGIRPQSYQSQVLTFYFAEEDGPHFQVFSINEQHVRDHYPNGHIRTLIVPTITITEFLSDVSAGPIDLLSLDIEGIDAEILMEIDWQSLQCSLVSFEYIHLGNNACTVYRALRRGGYWRVGSGMDHRGYDLLYAKPETATKLPAVIFRAVGYRTTRCVNRLTRLAKSLLKALVGKSNQGDNENR